MFYTLQENLFFCTLSCFKFAENYVFPIAQKIRCWKPVALKNCSHIMSDEEKHVKAVQ